VTSWPIPSGQKAWLSQFLAAVNAFLSSEAGLRGEFFLDYQTVQQVERNFLRHSVELLPYLGLARRPGASLPDRPTDEELKDAAKVGKELDFADYTPTYSYWFLNKDLSRLLPLFFGHGGTSMIYLARDPNAVPLKIPYVDEIKQIIPGLPLDKLEAMSSAATSMADPFLKKSKELFGIGLEEEPQYAGLPFIVPLLRTSDFFELPDEANKWLELFDVHWRESPVDKGIFLASKIDIEANIIEILNKMTEAGQTYPMA
jgi:hypothetical protein